MEGDRGQARRQLPLRGLRQYLGCALLLRGSQFSSTLHPQVCVQHPMWLVSASFGRVDMLLNHVGVIQLGPDIPILPNDVPLY